MPGRAVDTPIGTLGLVASAVGLSQVRWSAKGLALDGSSDVLDEAARQLEAYFAGELTAFDLPLDVAGTDFQRGCWLALAEIRTGRRSATASRRGGSASAPTRRAPSAPQTARTRCRSCSRAIA